MHCQDHLNQFIKLFRYLIIVSIFLFVIALVLWPYIEKETWILLVLLANSIILSVWLFYIHPIYETYVKKKLDDKYQPSASLNINEITKTILKINSLMKQFEELITIEHTDSHKSIDLFF